FGIANRRRHHQGHARPAPKSGEEETAYDRRRAQEDFRRRQSALGENQGRPRKIGFQFRSAPEPDLRLHPRPTSTTNSPLSERWRAVASNSAGWPRRNSSNFFVSSRASTTVRSGKTLFNSPSSFSTRYGDS